MIYVYDHIEKCPFCKRPVDECKDCNQNQGFLLNEKTGKPLGSCQNPNCPCLDCSLPPKCECLGLDCLFWGERGYLM